MRIAMIGTGYVGLVSGACFAEFGNDVTCVDKDTNKIDTLLQGKVPIYEPGLDKLISTNVEQGRLKFTTDLKEGIKGADIVYIAVGTPSRQGDGYADLSYIFAAAEEVAELLERYTVVVMKSTVPVGTGEKVAATIRRINPNVEFDVVSNPEFLREGSAINEFMNPERVVIGTDSKRAADMMQQLYHPLALNNVPILMTPIQSAELIKYASNAFLATKVSFINEIADFCEKTGADIQEVAQGMGLDQRINGKFLHAGPGFGGSCFPKDTRALLHSAEQAGTLLRIVDAVVASNEDRKLRMADKIIAACGGDVRGKIIAVLGVTFKPNTDDMREAPSLDIVPALQQQGAIIQAYDPQAASEGAHLLKDVNWANDAYEAIQGANCLVVLTEWNEFQALDLHRVHELMSAPLIVDLRNIYKVNKIIEAGFDYHSVGRKPVFAASRTPINQSTKEPMKAQHAL